MSNSFQLLKELIENNQDCVDVGASASEQLVCEAEKYLDVKFPESLRLYLETWGTLAIGPLEFYGITGDDFVNSKVPDGVWFTKNKREQISLPNNLFVIFNNEGDEYHCVDVVTGKVVIWSPISSEVLGVKAEDICKYILNESEDFI